MDKLDDMSERQLRRIVTAFLYGNGGMTIFTHACGSRDCVGYFERATSGTQFQCDRCSQVQEALESDK